MAINEIKKTAIENILIRLTFDGAFQRSKIYGNSISEDKRKEFRNSMAALLSKYLKKIGKRKKYDDRHHYRTMEAFANEVTRRHRDILYGKKMRIGSAQKFLNLYWKVSWLLLKGVKRPIHCPFDSLIMKQLPVKVRVSWTRFDTLDAYRKLVEAVQDKIGNGNSIAEWELRVYLETVNYTNN